MYELNTLDAWWIVVDVWSNSSRCRIVSVYLSWSYLDILITMLNSINYSTVIRSPTVILVLSWEKPLVKPMAPGSILHHKHVHGLSRFILGHLSIAHAPSISHPYSPLMISTGSLYHKHTLSPSPCIHAIHVSLSTFFPCWPDLYWTCARGVSLRCKQSHTSYLRVSPHLAFPPRRCMHDMFA